MQNHLLAVLMDEGPRVVEAEEGDVEEQRNVLSPVNPLDALEHQTRQKNCRQIASARSRKR